MITIKLDIRPIEEDGFHIFTEAFINGKKTRLLIDTGASRTVFDEERIRIFLDDDNESFEKIDKLSTGLGTSSMESHQLVLREFRLGESIFKEYSAIVLNMEHVNHSYNIIGEPPIDGVLGGDLLQELKVTIDYRKKEMRWREDGKSIRREDY